MPITCSICGYPSKSLKQAYNHSSSVHTEHIFKSKYTITSCLLCTFSHENPNIVKTHAELLHNNSSSCEFITHHRFKSRLTAIKEKNELRVLNAQFISEFFKVGMPHFFPAFLSLKLSTAFSPSCQKFI